MMLSWEVHSIHLLALAIQALLADQVVHPILVYHDFLGSLDYQLNLVDLALLYLLDPLVCLADLHHHFDQGFLEVLLPLCFLDHPCSQEVLEVQCHQLGQVVPDLLVVQEDHSAHQILQEEHYHLRQI